MVLEVESGGGRGPVSPDAVVVLVRLGAAAYLIARAIGAFLGARP